VASDFFNTIGGELTFRRAAIYRDLSWTPEEPQVESCEHQNNANIHRQSFRDSVSEEHEIYTDYEGCHCHRVKHDSYLSAHSSGNAISKFPSPDPPPQ
jgi:hypothetical protein